MSRKPLLLAALLALVLLFPFVDSSLAAPSAKRPAPTAVKTATPKPPTATPTPTIAPPSAKYVLYVPGGTSSIKNIPGAQVLPGNTHSWNGSLMVFAHGYTIPDSSEDSILAYLQTQVPALAQMANDRGYMFAASTYSKAGYSIREGVYDTNDLVRFIRQYATKLTGRSLRYLYIIGASEGGLIAVDLLENNSAGFSGGISGCGAVAGWQPMVQYDGDYRVLLDYYFGDLLSSPSNPYPLGTESLVVPPGLFSDWQDETLLMDAGVTDPSQLPVHSAYRAMFFTEWARTESLVRSAKVAVNPDAAVARKDANADAAMKVLNYVILGTTDQSETAGGNAFDNRTTVYLDPVTGQPLSGVERPTVSESAVAFVRANYSPSGQLTKPLITVHNSYDSEVPYSMEARYQSLVQAAGRSGNLQIRSSENAYGHCMFTDTDMSNALLQLFLKVGDWGGILGSPAETSGKVIPMAAGPR